MNTRNTMTFSYNLQIKSTEYKGVTFLFLFGTWTLALFPHAGTQPEIFQGRKVFVELGNVDNHFVKNTQRKGPLGKKYFLLDIAKTTFWMKNLTQRLTQLGPFFPKLGHFFWSSKNTKGGLHISFPSCVPAMFRWSQSFYC